MVYSAVVHVAEALHPARCRLSLGNGIMLAGTRPSPPTWARVLSAALLMAPSHAIELASRRRPQRQDDELIGERRGGESGGDLGGRIDEEDRARCVLY